MENLNEEKEGIKKESGSWKWVAVTAVIILVVTQIYYIGLNAEKKSRGSSKIDQKQIVLGSGDDTSLQSGVELPIEWQDLGKKMVEAGAIDGVSFEKLYAGRGGLTPEEKELLSGMVSGKVAINQQNAGYWLNLLWAFGLANKNPILENGPMQNPEYGGAGRFASTGGWSLAKGDPMDHYSKHELVKLTADQQVLVETISKGIYRPCCGNLTHFPDCNHGMAMMGLLELMAANGASETEMYKVALQVNAYWFPDTYRTIDQYLRMNGKSLATADPKEILGASYSSAQGYSSILSQVQTPEKKSSGGGGCSV